jgi:beta propeller repeat protein
MSRGEKLKIRLAVSVILSVTGWANAAGEPNDWMVVQLTDNTYHDRYPRVSGTNVVWQGKVDNKDTEIFLYDGAQVIQLTDNTSAEDYPDVSGSNVVWWCNEHVFLYDGVSIRQLSDSSITHNSPAQICGSNVVWDGVDGGDYDIYLYNIDANQTTQLTNNDLGEWSPYASDSHVVWYGFDGEDYEIYLYDIATGETVQITNNSSEDIDPQVDGSYVVWMGREVGEYDVYLYDMETGQTTQLTDTFYGEFDCRISGSYVVWYGLDGWDFEIYLYKIESDELLKLTDNEKDDFSPEISGSGVVWYGSDGTNWEIYMYDIETDEIFELTDNTTTDYFPDISSKSVAWYGYGGMDFDIFFAGPVADIDASFLAHDFGEVEVGLSEAVGLTISNTGSFPLTINDVAFQEGSSIDISVTYEVEMPFVLRGGRSFDVTITYTPSAAEAVSAVLEIDSDDADEASIAVELSGMGFVQESSGPAEQMKQILAFFDQAVEEGKLRGNGRGWSAGMRLRLFRFMLLKANYFIEKEMFRASCWQLNYAYKRADGRRWPRDLVVGEATEELAGQIKELMVSLECECSCGWPKCCHKYGMRHGCMWWPCKSHKCHK